MVEEEGSEGSDKTGVEDGIDEGGEEAGSLRSRQLSHQDAGPSGVLLRQPCYVPTNPLIGCICRGFIMAAFTGKQLAFILEISLALLEPSITS
jgi:hypothetical protein